MKMMKVSIDLFDERPVIRVTGSAGGIGTCKTEYKMGGSYSYDQIEKDLLIFKDLLSDPRSDATRDKISDMGTKLFDEIFVDQILFLYKLCNRADSELSLSFTIHKDHISLPIEFLLDKYKDLPVATRIPIYKTITTKGDLYPKRKELDPSEEVNILLVSSNTFCEIGGPVLIGDNPEKSKFSLPRIDGIDDDGCEIKIIKKIIDDLKESKEGPWKKLNVEIYNTDELDYRFFLDLIDKNNYDIIHYNGHGYYDSKESEKSSIFFWESKPKQGKVVFLDTFTLNNILEGKSNLRFVYLSCCQSGAAQEGPERLLNSFTGLLHSVVNAGVPNVLGMRWPISTTDARNFSDSFYKSLFCSKDHNTIEYAVMKARRNALHYSDHTVWCSPILIKQDF